MESITSAQDNQSHRSIESKVFGNRSITRLSSADSTNTGQPTTRILPSRRVSFFDFKGLMAPVFSAFRDDENCSLNVTHIEQYASWLKAHKINAIAVNSICGEGPAMTTDERKQNTEHWFRAAIKHDLMMMVQIGAAALPDVLEMARHAQHLGVHAVTCLPDLFYRPGGVKQLLAYCKAVAQECHQTPFFYYHAPKITNVEVDMVEFCKLTESHIPNFFGIVWGDSNLEDGLRCLQEDCAIILAHSTSLAVGLSLGFLSAKVVFLNVCPDDGVQIYKAVVQGKLPLAQGKQNEINKLMQAKCGPEDSVEFIARAKTWFNTECRHKNKAFEAGPTRYILD